MPGPVEGKAAALGGLKVVEIASDVGEYCGKLYADLGADVLLVEPVGGSPTRLRTPFFGDEIGPNTSIPFSYFNAGKKSVALDLDSTAGQRQLLDLLRDADLLIEAMQPGRLAALGVTRAVLSDWNPRLVVVSITPFGQSGPYANFQADDLTLLSLGGLLAMGGYHDGVPTAVYGNQAYLAGAQFAAVSSMAALLAADTSGTGHDIDVSIHESVVMGLENAAQVYQLEGKLRHRIGGTQTVASNGQFPCKDGFFYLFAAGLASIRFWMLAVAWLQEEKAAGAEQFNEPRWQDRAFLATDEAKQRFHDVFAAFTKTRTKAELFKACRERRIPAGSVAAPIDVIDDPQSKHRGFIVEVENAHLGKAVVSPGAPYQLSETPCRVGGPVPRIGEHTHSATATVPETSNRRKQSTGSYARPLDGIRIIDFAWIGAGSYTTKILGDLGAEVIKIESTKKVDDLRLAAPYKDGKPGVNRSGYFADRNTSKRSLLLNVKTKQGLAIARQLLADCDVVANNFSTGCDGEDGSRLPGALRAKPQDRLSRHVVARQHRAGSRHRRLRTDAGGAVRHPPPLRPAGSRAGRHRHALSRSHPKPVPRGLCAAGRAAIPEANRTRAVDRPRADGTDNRTDRSGDHRTEFQRPRGAADRQPQQPLRAARRLPGAWRRPLDRDLGAQRS